MMDEVWPENLNQKRRRSRAAIAERNKSRKDPRLDSRTFETHSRPALARRYPRDFTFYLGIPFLDCSFAVTSPNGANGMSDIEHVAIGNRAG
jgi:hypothetical protein